MSETQCLSRLHSSYRRLCSAAFLDLPLPPPCVICNLFTINSEAELQSVQKKQTRGSLRVIENAIYDACERLSTDAIRGFAVKCP